MTTKDLIDAALAAQTASDVDIAAANQALHDDLAANGPAVIVDETTTPLTVTMYSAVDPDTWTSAEIRVAA
jgi:hypothetical protein